MILMPNTSTSVVEDARKIERQHFNLNGEKGFGFNVVRPNLSSYKAGILGSKSMIVFLTLTRSKSANKLVLTVLIVVAQISFACIAYQSSMGLTIDGKLFSDAEVSVDGFKVGNFDQLYINRSGEQFIKGKHVGQIKDKKRLKYLASMADEFDYTGVLLHVVLKPGLRKITFTARDGTRLEVEKQISPGEHYFYLSYDQATSKLIWDNKEYSIFPGQVVKIAEE